MSGGWEQARSLGNRDPFSIFSTRSGFQPNLAVIEADAVSVKLAAGARAGLRSATYLDLRLGLERADRDVAGDLSFTLLTGELRLDVATLGDQRLTVRGQAQLPGSAGAPPQRWRALGGWGSLPTLRPVEGAGDRMWWAAATYRVPLARQVDVLGRLSGWLEYAAGNAWIDSAEPRPPVVHNLGAGLTLGPLAAGVYSDPGRDFHTVMVLGIEPRPRR